MKKLLTILILLCIMLIVSCKKETDLQNNTTEPPVVVVDSTLLPQVQTMYVNNITQESADCRGKIVNWETAGATNYGFCWDTLPNPNMNNNHLQSTIIMGGVFGLTLIDLSPSTTYYIRAYAENSKGLAYGNVIEFKTLDEDPHPGPWSPTPVNGEIPTSVLPSELASEISQYISIYQGVNPPEVEGQFIVSPYILFHATSGDTTNILYHDRYIAFFRHGDRVDFFGKQWDDYANAYYLEAYRQLNVIGDGNNFTTYYIVEGYPNGMYAKQSVIFSGTWDVANNAINDFKVVTILLATGGNPNLGSVNSYCIFGDEDGVSEYNPWIDSK